MLDTRLPQIPLCKGCEINPSLVGDYSMGHSVFCGEHCRRYFLGIGYRPIWMLIEERQRYASKATRPRRVRPVSNMLLVSKQEQEAIWDALRRYKTLNLRVLWLSALGYLPETVARETGLDAGRVHSLVNEYKVRGLEIFNQYEDSEGTLVVN